MKIFIISVLFSVLSFAAHAHERGTECYELRRSADNDCLRHNIECRNLGACAHRRNSCPASVKSKSGCEGINQCMSDTEGLVKKRPSDIRKAKFKHACEYKWTTYGKGSCRLYNIAAEFITFPTCPGRRITGKNNDDVNFDCEGHRVVVKESFKKCISNREVYNKKCSMVKGYEELTTGIKVCKYENVKIFPADSVHKGSKTVDDSERSKHKIVPHEDGGASGDGKATLGSGK